MTVAAIPFVLAGVSAAVQVASTIAAGNAQKTAFDYQAQQAQQAAGQARAVSQRQDVNEQRTAAFAQSKLQNDSAASGADPDGVSTVNASQNIAGIGKYNELADLYTGEEKARGLETSANLDEFQGNEATSAAQLKAFGTIASTGTTLYSQYGFGQPGVGTGTSAGQTLTGPSGANTNVPGLPWTYSPAGTSGGYLPYS